MFVCRWSQVLVDKDNRHSYAPCYRDLYPVSCHFGRVMACWTSCRPVENETLVNVVC